jgi:hypothetical protein
MCGGMAMDLNGFRGFISFSIESLDGEERFCDFLINLEDDMMADEETLKICRKRSNQMATEGFVGQMLTR